MYGENKSMMIGYWVVKRDDLQASIKRRKFEQAGIKRENANEEGQMVNCHLLQEQFKTDGKWFNKFHMHIWAQVL